ncbi:MAG: hypothetical protein WCC37_02945 [Candidatus Sulfotelmatobacter sp.]
MSKGQILMTLTLSLLSVSLAWAQSDENQTPAPAPVPAFGQENPAPPVSENPPISAIDQPGLEPHAAPESFLLPGLHFSESVDSNAANTVGGSSTGLVTRGLGSLTLQKLWRNYDVAADYIGGVSYYNVAGIGLQQLQQFDIDNRINWKRGQLAIRDSFSYLPEGAFGFAAYGGSGAYNLGMGSMGTGLLGANAFGGQSNVFSGGEGVSLGQVPRITNLGLADIVESLTPKSSLTLAAGYGLVHFDGDLASPTSLNDNIAFIGSRETTAQVGYDYSLNAKDQVALSYGYQSFDFSTVGTAFHSNVIQAMYGHRISGRLSFIIGAGPQFTHIDANPPICLSIFGALSVPLNDCTTDGGTIAVIHTSANHIGAVGRVSLRYKFPKTSVSFTFQRYDTSGSGIFAGSLSNIALLDMRRPLSRVWDLFSDVGYSKNSRLQIPGSAVNANEFTYWYAGAGLHRQFGRSLRGFVSYQFNDMTFDTSCPLVTTAGPGLAACSNLSRRQVGSIGLDWTPRPIRLD